MENKLNQLLWHKEFIVLYSLLREKLKILSFSFFNRFGRLAIAVMFSSVAYKFISVIHTQTLTNLCSD